MDNLRVLVVEDDPDGQDVVSRIFRFHKIPVNAVFSAEEALTELSTTPFNLVVIDLALPEMDGWGLLEHILNDPQTAQLPCVAITAYHSAEVAVKAIAAGFMAYFPKPLEATSFMREIQRIMN
jgi:CheY-like chemotaxis protein